MNRFHSNHLVSFVSLLGFLSTSLTSTTTMALTTKTTNAHATGNSATPLPKLAVIGAGAAGLAAARVLQRAGLMDQPEQVVILEKDTDIGGVWNYKQASKDRPMYRKLRTNLPKEVMRYREYPFPKEFSKSFVTHGQVFDYLQRFRTHFNLPVRFGCTVNKLKVLHGDDGDDNNASCVEHAQGDQPWPKIQLEWTNQQTQQDEKDTFDAVYIANGHYSLPQIPHIPGIEHFKGHSFHSIEYDEPQEFKDLRILCIGGRASGADIAREMAEAGATHVYLSDAAKKDGTVETLGTQLSWVPATTGVREDGSIEFGLDCQLYPQVDVIVYATGYDYDFPFIKEDSNLPLDSQNRRVQPLYEQLWHAKHPNVAFLGLPHSVVPFPLFELQAEACLEQWTNMCTLPNLAERMQHAENALGGEGKTNGRVSDTHYLGSKQWDYCRRMAKYGGVYNEEVEAFIATNEKLYDHAGGLRKGEFPAGPDTYREYVYERDDSSSGFRLIHEPATELVTNAE